MAKQTKIIGGGITARAVTSYTGPDIADAIDHMVRLFSADPLIEAERSCRAFLAGAGAGPFEQDSAEDYAQRILRLITLARACVARGDADNAARLAFAAGCECTEARMKGQWERHAVRGLKNVSALKEATRANNKNKTEGAARLHAKWQALAQKMWAGNKYLSKSDVAEHIAKTYGGNPSTIRRKISCTK